MEGPFTLQESQAVYLGMVYHGENFVAIKNDPRYIDILAARSVESMRRMVMDDENRDQAIFVNLLREQVFFYGAAHVETLLQAAVEQLAVAELAVENLDNLAGLENLPALENLVENHPALENLDNLAGLENHPALENLVENHPALANLAAKNLLKKITNGFSELESKISKIFEEKKYEEDKVNNEVFEDFEMVAEMLLQRFEKLGEFLEAKINGR